MNIFEQLMEENGYEGFIQTIIDAGVNDDRMHRFMNTIMDENGNLLYNKWLEENAERISEKLGENHMAQKDVIPLAVTIVNEFMTWLDGALLMLLREV